MIALRNLLRHPIRAVLALAGIAVTTAMLLDMVLLAGGIERSFGQLLLGRGYQVRVSPKGTLPFDSEATIPGAQRVASVIRADSAVESVAAMLGAPVYARRGAALVTLFGYGVEPEAQSVYQVERGQDLGSGDSLGLLLSQPAAVLLGAAIGDTLVLVSGLDPQMAVAGNARRVVVRGLVTWLYDTRGQPSVGTLLPVLQELAGYQGEDRVSVLAVRVAGDPGAAVERLQRALPDVAVNSIEDMLAQFRERLVYFRQLSYILGSISLGVTVLLISTLMTITINERLGEIATLRAIGVRRSRIVQGVMLEGAALTLLGGGLGVVLGSATARLLDRILTSFPGLPAAISFFVPEPRSLALAGLVLALAGILSGVYPAWLAASAPIAETLRTEAT
jgi:putative ABC transport system permease protein